MFRRKGAGWKDRVIEEFFSTKVEEWGWHMGKGTIFPEIRGKKENHHEEMKTYWFGER